MKNVDKLIFFFFLFFRLASIPLIQTSFVPDEYWQSLEVAHKLEFGYGYLTWEWKKAIRSCVYPKLISLIYKIFPDVLFTLTVLPRAFQALLSSVGDYCTVKLATNVFGSEAGKWTFFSICTSWFLFYCSSRTLTNMAETSFTACGLFLYPWKKQSSVRPKWKYLWMVGCSVLTRPTAAIFWLPFCVWHIWREKENAIYIFNRMFFSGTIFLVILVLTDYSCYGYWVLTPYQFFIFNWANDIGAFYGSHPWHWYFTIGLPVVLSVHFIPLLLGLQLKKTRTMFFFVLFYVIVLSQLSHKEFRFLLPVLPLCLCICGATLAEMACGNIWIWKWKLSSSFRRAIISVMFVVNIPIALYMGLVHQKGTLAVVNYLSQSVTEHSSVLYLMPCHSTPFYSHIHKNISMKFLTCEPNFSRQDDYVDEADLFFSHPRTWLNWYLSIFDNFHEIGGNTMPSHIVMFSHLVDTIIDILHTYDYKSCYSTKHTDFVEKRTGKNVHVFCKR